VDAAGTTYLAFNSAGDGQGIQVISAGFFANDVATSLTSMPNETDVVGASCPATGSFSSCLRPAR
jgi:hypothetical protein